VLLWVAGVAVALTVIIFIIVSSTDTLQKAALQRASELCARATTTTGSAPIAPDDIPKKVDKDLTLELDAVVKRNLEWRKRQVGDKTVCEMRYCYTGRKANRQTQVCSDWYETP
jgi:hypothetical protein